MTRLDLLAESIEEETGFHPAEANREVPPDALFHPYITGLERFDSEDYIYLRDKLRCYKIQKSHRIRIYLMGLKYLHDFQT